VNAEHRARLETIVADRLRPLQARPTGATLGGVSTTRRTAGRAVYAGGLT